MNNWHFKCFDEAGNCMGVGGTDVKMTLAAALLQLSDMLQEAPIEMRNGVARLTLEAVELAEAPSHGAN